MSDGDKNYEDIGKAVSDIMTAVQARYTFISDCPFQVNLLYLFAGLAEGKGRAILDLFTQLNSDDELRELLDDLEYSHLYIAIDDFKTEAKQC